MKKSVCGKMTVIFRRNDGIICGGEDHNRHGEGGEKTSRQGVEPEIVAVMTELRVIGHDGLGQPHAGFVMKDLVKVIEVGKTELLCPEREFPLGHKIMTIDRESGIDSKGRFIGIESGTDTEYLPKIGNRGVGLTEGDPEGKISSK